MTASTPAFAPSQRHDGWTASRQRNFCLILSECGQVGAAAISVGMTRQGAYYFRRTRAGQGFGLAWDAALLLARQKMIDEAYELAMTGSIEQILRDGVVIAEKRKRDPQSLIAAVERLGKSEALGRDAVIAVADEFESFLECLEAEANGHQGATADFLERRADEAGPYDGGHLRHAQQLLERAAIRP